MVELSANNKAFDLNKLMWCFNNIGKKEWEFVNKDKNGNIGFVSWSRIIENELFIEKFKSQVKNKQCLN